MHNKLQLTLISFLMVSLFFFINELIFISIMLIFFMYYIDNKISIVTLFLLLTTTSHLISMFFNTAIIIVFFIILPYALLYNKTIYFFLNKETEYLEQLKTLCYITISIKIKKIMLFITLFNIFNLGNLHYTNLLLTIEKNRNKITNVTKKAFLIKYK